MNNQIVTLKELAFELKTTPKGLRKWLRDNKFPKPGKRWEWDSQDPQLAKIRKERTQPKESKKKKPPEDELQKELEGIGKGLDNTIKSSAAEKLKESAEEIERGAYKVFTKGNWTVWRNAITGAVMAEYKGPKSTDRTPYYSEVSAVRPSLPKAIKEAVINAITGAPIQ